jgi:acetamidase/formamidase
VKGLEPGYAYSLASVAVDFHVSEAVDQTQVVTGKIPKATSPTGPVSSILRSSF